MSFSRVLFLGLGGAGQRHLRVLHEMLPPETQYGAFRHTGQTPLLNADFSVDDARSLESRFRLAQFGSLDEAFFWKPDLTVISTPTARHIDGLQRAAEIGSSILVEKPWSDSLTAFEAFARTIINRKLSFQISFQRRFHPHLANIRSLLQTGAIGKPITGTIEVYSNVPSWHAYEDWRQLYAVRADQGGGVLLTEIHEIDFVTWVFGLPDAVYCVGGNRGPVALDVEDTAQMCLVYPAFSLSLTLCFMHGAPRRTLRVLGTEGELSWNDRDNCLCLTRLGATETFRDSLMSNDGLFRAQAREFLFDWSRDKTFQALWASAATLSVVRAAKRSMRSALPELVRRDEVVALEALRHLG